MESSSIIKGHISFSLHGVDVHDKTKLKQSVKRNKLLDKIANIP
ncbi:hypothetical protein swp_1906 [Shewanella piezotolerans WP3]|uniref:Uncharacterized protein n=1 Tax=Shewanella piezotolerans (strain WP3 / JCM 13877) TaxID=225849 RepID=B8CLL4_SHEPW|nr:hypothetical protein swp_1906 [Shewanella piezotolerans WP3]